jgi:hypothetical protein
VPVVTSWRSRQSGHKWCELLHKNVDKKVMVTQIKRTPLQRATQHCFMLCAGSVCAPFVAPSTRQDDIQLRAKKSAVKDDQFLRSLLLSDP